MSKRTCLSLETSAVNLMLELKLFAISRNAASASLPCIHFMSMSSLNLRLENGFSFTDCSSSFSSLPMNMLAYDEAIFKPMSVL